MQTIKDFFDMKYITGMSTALSQRFQKFIFEHTTLTWNTGKTVDLTIGKILVNFRDNRLYIGKEHDYSKITTTSLEAYMDAYEAGKINRFKAGDKVVCIREDWTSEEMSTIGKITNTFELGDELTVQEIITSNAISLVGMHGGYPVGLFKLQTPRVVEDKKVDTFELSRDNPFKGREDEKVDTSEPTLENPFKGKEGYKVVCIRTELNDSELIHMCGQSLEFELGDELIIERTTDAGVIFRSKKWSYPHALFQLQTARVVEDEPLEEEIRVDSKLTHSFKEGDKVVCIREEWTDDEAGVIGKVRNFFELGDELTVTEVENTHIVVGGEGYAYPPGLFKLQTPRVIEDEPVKSVQPFDYYKPTYRVFGSFDPSDDVKKVKPPIRKEKKERHIAPIFKNGDLVEVIREDWGECQYDTNEWGVVKNFFSLGDVLEVYCVYNLDGVVKVKIPGSDKSSSYGYPSALFRIKQEVKEEEKEPLANIDHARGAIIYGGRGLGRPDTYYMDAYKAVMESFEKLTEKTEEAPKPGLTKSKVPLKMIPVRKLVK